MSTKPRDTRLTDRGLRLIAALALAGGLALAGARVLGAEGAGDPITPPPGLPLWSLRAELPAPAAQAPRELFHMRVLITGYSSTEDQTDDTPFVTASNTRVRSGTLALSRDLLRNFTPGAPFAFGDLVEVEGVGRFRVEDTMAPRYAKRADVWFSSREAAQRWGCRHLYLAQISPDAAREERRLQSRPSFPLFEVALTD